MAVDFTPWVDGVTEYQAAQMNAPLTELKESAQAECDLKAELAHEHVVADITDFPTTMDPAAHEHVWADITDPPSIGTGDMLSTNNLSDLTDAGDARDNLGLGDSAVLDVGMVSGAVAPGDHIHAVTNTTGTRLVSGGSVVWVSGYTYAISYATYYIEGTLYSANVDTVTLGAADETYDRIDVIVLGTTGDIYVLSGTPAENPISPVADPSYYVMLAMVYVAAQSTEAPIETTAIYKEGVEWTITSSATIAKDSTVDARTGTKSIEGTDVAKDDYFVATAAAELVLSDQDILVFYIKLKAAWLVTKSVKLAWVNNGVAVGSVVSVATGAYGFTHTLTGVYQQIVIPISHFGVPAGAVVDQLVFMLQGLGATVGFFVDDMELQAGINGTQVAVQSLNPRGAWSSTVAYSMNDTATLGGYTYYCLSANTAQSPATATSYWSVLSAPIDGIIGPASSIDNAIVRFDSITGKLAQDSLVTIDDSGAVNIPSGQVYKINGTAHGHAETGAIGISFEATAKPTAAGEYSFKLPYAMTVPANASTSVFYNKTNPTAQAVVSIKDDGTEIATLTVATNGTPTWATASGTEKVIAADSLVTFLFPAQDATWAGVVITLKGARTI